MLYNLIKKWRGKEEVMMTDELTKVNDRMKTLKKSSRKGVKGQRVEFFIQEAAEDDEKFRKEPHYPNQWTK
jgi:hypothetical protein